MGFGFLVWILMLLSVFPWQPPKMGVGLGRGGGCGDSLLQVHYHTQIPAGNYWWQYLHYRRSRDWSLGLDSIQNHTEIIPPVSMTTDRDRSSFVSGGISCHEECELLTGLPHHHQLYLICSEALKSASACPIILLSDIRISLRCTRIVNLYLLTWSWSSYILEF